MFGSVETTGAHSGLVFEMDFFFPSPLDISDEKTALKMCCPRASSQILFYIYFFLKVKVEKTNLDTFKSLQCNMVVEIQC